MLSLFLATFATTVAFLIFFLWKLPEDIKRQSIRPLFVLLIIIAFWITTLPAFLVPEETITYNFPTTNVIANQIGTSTANILYNYPAYTSNSVATISVRDYNTFFLVWLPMLTFFFFLLLLWYILLLRQKAGEALKKGGDVMEKFEDNW